MLLAIFLAAIAARVDAQQLEPRSYTNTPVGMNFLIAGYGYATGTIVSDPSIPLKNADIQTHELVLAYARGLDVWGLSGKVDAILPYDRASGSAEFSGEITESSVSGWGDPRLRFSVNFYGAPALSLKEFVDYQQDFIFGASLQITAPLGQYDPARVYNIGTNRWTIKPEFGISKAAGRLTLEFAAGVTFYGDNDEFLGDRTRTQDPLYSLQGHVIYNLRSGIWLALDGTYYTGGSTSVDGMEGGDRLSNSRVGLTVALPVTRHYSLKFYASTGVSARTGGDFDAVRMAWQTRWGGGL
ncbi:MAG: hypothetical protein AMJ54_15580 [Deltaproteobacteria bacterium SG8_13]|nr:MAG: hypothetical protein AMJ54_15580 [Deltaproteobacteria bacterium SG8_13]